MESFKSHISPINEDGASDMKSSGHDAAKELAIEQRKKKYEGLLKRLQARRGRSLTAK